MEIHINNKEFELAYEDMPHHVILFADPEKHLAAYAVKSPGLRYNGYIECPQKFSTIINCMIDVSWPITGCGYERILPGGITKSFRETVVVGWDYYHSGFPEFG